MDGITGASLRHLRLFETVARLRSVRKAADVFHLSQPAVTQAVAKLERQVDTVLFERRSSGTYLTPAGEILAARVGRMFQQIEDALAAFCLDEEQTRSLASIAERITRPQIRTLNAMADGSSFAEATRRGSSPASLHRAARELERSLGRSLVQKGLDGLAVTPAGCELARQLSLAMRELEWGVEEVRAATGDEAGQLRIGAMPLAGSFLLTPVLNDFMRCSARARLQVRTGDRHDLTKALRLGEVDFVVGLMREPADLDEIEQEPLITLPYVLVARRGHPLARKAKVTRKDLEDYDWIAPTHSASRRVAFDRLMATMGKTPHISIEASSLSTIRLLSDGSDHLALLARFEFEHERSDRGLSLLPFAGIEPAHPLGIMRRANWQPTPLHRHFLELIRAHAAALAAGETRRDQAA
jgi:DNA-binding transcriptional LysR family regulator